MSDESIPMPPSWRIFVAFVLTPYIVAFGLISIDDFLSVGHVDARKSAVLAAVGSLLFGYPITMVFGWPLFLVLRKRVRSTALNCSLAGAFVLALSAFIVGIHSGIFLEPQTPMSILGLVVTVAMLGGVAGFIFWLIAAAGAKRGAEAWRRGSPSPLVGEGGRRPDEGFGRN